MWVYIIKITDSGGWNSWGGVAEITQGRVSVQLISKVGLNCASDIPLALHFNYIVE